MTAAKPSSLPASLSIGLKEWDAVCRALGEGRQIFILRKGGIVEQGGAFSMRSPAFVFLPTHEHQNELDFKPAFQHLVRPGPGPAGPFTAAWAALAEDVRPVTPDQARALLPLSVWSEAYLEKKLTYRPDLPLYFAALRVFKSDAPRVVPADPSYAGCVSWVALSAPVPMEGFSPTLSDGEFSARRVELARVLG